MVTYYAIFTGVFRGVYTDFSDIQTFIEKDSELVWKKFASIHEAAEFAENGPIKYKIRCIDNDSISNSVKTDLSKNKDKINNLFNINKNRHAPIEKYIDMQNKKITLEDFGFTNNNTYTKHNWDFPIENVWLNAENNNEIFAFISGFSHKKIGSKKNKGKYGIFFPQKDIQNKIGEKHYGEITGTQSVIRSELYGIEKTLKILVLNDWVRVNRPLIWLITESPNANKYCTTLLYKWKRTNWVTKGGNAIKNRDILIGIDVLLKSLRVKFKLINASKFTNSQDKWLIAINTSKNLAKQWNPL